MRAGSGGSSDPAGSRGQGQGGMDVEAVVPAQRAASDVLADRMAAALVHREPGWQLPRRSALARRYNVGLAEIDAAIGELTRRSLIRRLPDGQLYRSSPGEYLIPLEGIGGAGPRAISVAYVPGPPAAPAPDEPAILGSATLEPATLEAVLLGPPGDGTAA